MSGRAGVRSVCLAMTVLAGLAAEARGAATVAAETTIPTADWAAYRDRFVEDSGRIVDDANGRISHSEGQGYGLLLAFEAGDRVSFERIWSFTRDELLIRDDGLAAWKWDPAVKPHVTDVNSASDGDTLIAYALGLAGKAWGDKSYTDAARALAKAIGEHLIDQDQGGAILRPAPAGFGAAERSDGLAVVNPSYWIFEALPVLNELAPEYPWQALARTGVDLIDRARFGPSRLPSDWVAITSPDLSPAQGFPPVFGYNAIRIPLYLLRGGLTDKAFLAPYAAAMPAGAPSVIDIETGRKLETLGDPGYRMVAAAVACAVDGTRIPDDLRLFTPTSYYPSTLYLLAMSYVTGRQPQCL